MIANELVVVVVVGDVVGVVGVVVGVGVVVPGVVAVVVPVVVVADISYRHVERALDADTLVRIEQLEGQLVRRAGAVDVVRLRVVERARGLRRGRQGRGRIYRDQP